MIPPVSSLFSIKFTTFLVKLIKNFLRLDESTEAVTAVVHGIILGVPVAFQLPNPDGCKDSGLECPLSAGKTYHYQASLPVLRKYPRVGGEQLPGNCLTTQSFVFR